MIRISLHDAPPFRVPADQALALCNQTSHLGRLCERIRAAADTDVILHLLGKLVRATGTNGGIDVAAVERGLATALPIT